jgi:hypothetical protein
LADAERIASKTRPWAVRLENPNLQQYWQATGRGLGEQLEIGSGGFGSVPTTCLVTWTQFRVEVADKLANGFVWADTPYFRMSSDNLAKVIGQSTPPTQPPPSTSASLLAFPVPLNQIRSLRVVREGTVLKGFDALDENGVVVVRFNETEGRAFAQNHNLDIVWVSSKTGRVL